MSLGVASINGFSLNDVITLSSEYDYIELSLIIFVGDSVSDTSTTHSLKVRLRARITFGTDSLSIGQHSLYDGQKENSSLFSALPSLPMFVGWFVIAVQSPDGYSAQIAATCNDKFTGAASIGSTNHNSNLF
jgi:hypothetical protein